MANNGGRQAGGGGGNGPMNEHVEFTVKAEEDLYLSGSENTIRRVTAETNYSCLMLKTQRFSSLFRHYAKYHGLRKDDLEYYFVNPLENEDTPESVQLQRGDTIMVRKRRKPTPPEAAADDDEFFRDMRELLDDEEHMDAEFIVHSDGGRATATGSGSGGSKATGGGVSKPDAIMKDSATVTPSNAMGAHVENIAADGGTANLQQTQGNTAAQTLAQAPNVVRIKAHKCILTARTDYFKALFRKTVTTSAGSKMESVFRESEMSTINVEPCFSPAHIRMMMEFIYTNRISSLKTTSSDDLLCLLHLSDKWLLRDLKRLVEHELIRHHMSVHTVARMYGATEDYNAQRLSHACINFIMENLRQVTGNSSFEEEMKNYPHLCIPVLKAAADMIPEGPVHKKQRTDHGVSTTPSVSSTAALASSPVPDNDP